MITATCQRWRERRDSYRPAGEPIATRLYEVAPSFRINSAHQHQHQGDRP